MSQKIGFYISCKLSLRDSLHEMSKPIFYFLSVVYLLTIVQRVVKFKKMHSDDCRFVKMPQRDTYSLGDDRTNFGSILCKVR